VSVGERDRSGVWVDACRRVAEFYIGPVEELSQVALKPAPRRVSKFVDVVLLGLGRRDCSEKHLLHARSIKPRAKPIGIHLLGSTGVVFRSIAGGEVVSERLAICGEQPLIVVVEGVGNLLLGYRDEILQYLQDQIVRQGVQICDRWVLNPSSFVPVVDPGFWRLELAVDCVRKQILDLRDFCERNVRPIVEYKSLVIRKRGGVSSGKVILVEEFWGNPLAHEAVERPPCSHSTADDDGVVGH